MSTPVTNPAATMPSAIAFLLRPRGLGTAFFIGILIGGAHTLAMLPPGLVAGTSAFWDFPAGTVPGGGSDMGQVLVAYRYFVQSPWSWPLLQVFDLIPPKGTNIVWMDAMPVVALIGKLIYHATGAFVNVLGVYLFLCFALPGPAMAGFVWLMGERSIIAAAAAAGLTSAAPFLVMEWGHMALCGQFVIIVAFCGYILSLRSPESRGVAMAWCLVLPLTLLLNMYLFVMVGAIWFAGFGQRLLNDGRRVGFLATEAGAAISVVVITGLITGIIGADLQSASAGGFGVFSMNLASPFIPQRSGVIPPLWDYFLGSRSQVYNYLGLGVLILAILSLPALLRWLRGQGRAHIVLGMVLCGFWLFALSHKVTLGGRLLFTVPVPDALLQLAGIFRTSGRFFWPIAYLIIAASVVATLRSRRPMHALGILAVVTVVQLVDLMPMRLPIAETASRPMPPMLDRAQLVKITAAAEAVIILPRSGCLLAEIGEGADRETFLRLAQSSMEIELAASRNRRPINSALVSRDLLDCASQRANERAIMREPLRPAAVYFYLDDFMPADEQLGASGEKMVCRLIGHLRYCASPDRQASR